MNCSSCAPAAAGVTLSGLGLLRRAAAVSAGLPGVLEVQTYGDLLHLFVDNAALRAADRAALASGHGSRRPAPTDRAWKRRSCR